MKPEWLTVAAIVEINQQVVERTREPFCLLNSALLESALDSPINTYLYDNEEDILVLACRLLFAIARNHPFVQGNKRTGFHAAILFMRWNGYALRDPVHEEVIGPLIISVLENHLSEAGFVAEMRPGVIGKTVD